MVVPLDGSSRAERVLALAAPMARATGGKVVLLRVATLPVAFWSSPAPPLPSATVQTLLEVDRAEAMRYLSELAQGDLLDGVETKVVVVSGSEAATILAVAQAEQCDLIELASHGRSEANRWGLGGVADKVLRRARMSVLLLPAGEQVSARLRAGGCAPLRALVPLDGSALAETALVPASHLVAALAGSAPATLQVIGVVQLPTAARGSEALTALHPELAAQLQREIQRSLAAVLARLQQNPAAQHHVQLASAVEYGTDVAETLLHVAAHGLAAERDARVGEGCDLLVMTTHGHGGVPPGALGKVTARVLSAASVPLLLVPPPG